MEQPHSFPTRSIVQSAQPSAALNHPPLVNVDNTVDLSVVKLIHLASVIFSACLFLLRATWMVVAAHKLEKRWVKILPHCVDTVLLTSAVTLALGIQQYPFSHHWLTAKVIALLIYIVLGSVALKHGNSLKIRISCAVLACSTFSYIVATALTHRVLTPW